MKVESSNLKIIVGGLYLIVLSLAIYFLFSNFDIKDLTSYEFIKENRETILKYKDNNLVALIELSHNLEMNYSLNVCCLVPFTNVTFK